MILRTLARLSCCLILLTALPVASAPLGISLYTYYAEPPFNLTAPGTGLNAALANYLTRRSAGRYQFTPVLLPRKRLNAVIQSQQHWVVGWAAPAFFNASTQHRYRWSPAFETDSNLLIYRARQPLPANTLAELNNKTLGVVSGHQLPEAKQLLEQHRLRIEESPDNLQNLRKLLAGRVDAIWLSQSSLAYLKQTQPQLMAATRSASKPFSRFNRQFLSPLGNPELALFLRQTAQAMPHDPEWLKQRNRYR